MIDQASVFADRFRNNRQALQAAVLGQNSGVDPYTALRALQLLKESDSMQMAQQGQQPTEAPSLLQEAMQPPQMPMGMAVPGQQMSQAPQQSGGLEAMPVPEQDFAGGGIIAFAGGGSGDIEALQAKLTKASAAYQSAYREGTNNQEIIALMNEMQNLRRQLKSAQDAKSDDRPEEVGTAMYGKGPTIGLPEGKNAAPSPYEPPSPNQTRGLNPNATGDGRLNQATDPRVIPSAPQNPLRAQEADANIAYGPDASASPEQISRSINQAPPPDRQDAVPTDRGLGALAAPTFSAASRDRLNAALDAQAAFKSTESTITPPRGLQDKITALKGDQGSLKALEGLFGTDEASTKAQALLDKRLKELEDPDRNKFDKALGFFKAAGALQKTIDKDGRRVTPMGAAAEAMGDVASMYSGIRKEDRKAKQLIEDSQMALDKAGQARKDGLTSKAFDLENQADKDKTAAETLQADINAKKDQARATMLAATARAEGAAYSGDQQAASQRYATDVARLSAKERNETDERMRKLTAEGQVDAKNLAAYNAAYATLMRAEANIDKAINDDVNLKDLIKRIDRAERLDADGKLDKNKKAELENFRAKRARLEKVYEDRLKAATGPFNVISSRIMGAAGITDYTAKSIDQATFNSLPKGTKFMDPNGQIRTK
jgi:hypothetical protein